MKSHLKRLAVPRTWLIKRKGTPFITRPAPSGSPLDMCMPLVELLKQRQYAKTTKEVKRILRTQEVLIDGKRIRTHDRALGFLGTLAIPTLKAAYRLTVTRKNTLALIPVTGEDAKLRPCKVKGKTILPKGKVQLNCSGGINVIVDRDTFKRGDTVLIDLATGKVTKHLPFEEGALVFLNHGTHVGSLATVKTFTSRGVTLTGEDGDFETARAYCYVVGKGKPAFAIKA